jgi:hypothetical protein
MDEGKGTSANMVDAVRFAHTNTQSTLQARNR